MANRAKFSISNSTWIICAICIIYGLGSLWFYSNYTRIPVEKDQGFTYEARTNPFLALKQLTQAYDIEFHSGQDFKLFDNKLSKEDVIFINNSRIAMSESSHKKMKQWVEDGGNLVLLATEQYDYDSKGSRDKFLDELGIRLYEAEDIDYKNDDDDYLTKLKFNGYEEITKVSLSSDDGYLHDETGNAYFIGGNSYSDYMVQYEVKKGFVTILTDFSVWNNYRLNQQDHGMFFLQLIGNTKNVWFIYNRNQPSLFSLAIDKAPYFMISVGVLLLLVLFSNLWRQGAFKKDELPIQREIMQHISSAASFNYRLDKGFSLIEELRNSVFKKAKQIIYGFSSKSKSKQLEKIAEITGHSKEELKILWQEDNQNNEEFINKVKLIQQLRKQL